MQEENSSDDLVDVDVDQVSVVGYDTPAQITLVLRKKSSYSDQEECSGPALVPPDYVPALAHHVVQGSSQQLCWF